MKCIPGEYLIKLVERMPRVCKAVIKARGSYFEKSQIYFDILNTFFGYYMIPYVFIILMSSLLFYNVENCKEKPSEYPSPNF